MIHSHFALNFAYTSTYELGVTSMSTHLLGVKGELLGGKAEHRGHKEAGDVHSHDALVAGLPAQHRKAGQALVHRLRHTGKNSSRPSVQ